MRTTLRSAQPRLPTFAQASRLPRLKATWTRQKPATERPMIASPTGCTTTTDQQVSAKATRYRRLPLSREAKAKTRDTGKKRKRATNLSSATRPMNSPPKEESEGERWTRKKRAHRHPARRAAASLLKRTRARE